MLETGSPAESSGPERGTLTDRQRRFVTEYLVDMNATQAAIRAGYSRDTAGSIGHENLTKPEIDAAVQAGLAEQTRAAYVRAGDIVRELRAIATADVRRMFRDGRLLDPSEMDDETAAAVASIEFTTRKVAGGEVENVAKVRLWDKTRALELLARRAWPERKGRPVHFDLAELKTAEDCMTASATVLREVASGRLSPEEGQQLAALLEAHREATVAKDLEARIARMEEKA